MVEVDDGSVRVLVGRLIDDGKAYAKAEADLVRIRVENEVATYRKAAILGAVGAMFAVSSIICLCLTLVLAFVHLFGPLVGGLIATLLVGAVAAILFYLGYRSIEKNG